MAGPTGIRWNILREITQLSRTILQIDRHFATITKAIRRFDLLEVLRDANTHPLQFFPHWKSCRELYKTLLCSSHSTAIQLKGKIDDSLKILIPLLNNPDIPLSDKQERLVRFIEALDEFQTRGTDTAQEFNQLRERIRNFERTITKEVETQDTSAAQRINEISDHIKQIEIELEVSSGFFSACRSVLNARTVLGSIPSSAGVGGLAGLIALAPVSSTLLLVSGVGALGYGISKGLDQRAQEIQGKRDKISNLQLESESLGSQRDEIQEIRVEMIQLTSTFDEIVTRLGAMQQIWKMISSDAVGLQEAMSQLRNARTPAGFDARIQDVEALWHTLAWTLDAYARGVVPSWGSILKRYWPWILVVLWELGNLYLGC